MYNKRINGLQKSDVPKLAVFEALYVPRQVLKHCKAIGCNELTKSNYCEARLDMAKEQHKIYDH